MLQLLWFGKKTITNSLNIYIKTSGGSTLCVDLDPSWDIKNLKEYVAPKLGLEPEQVKIIFAGKELGDRITIAECDLGEQSILHAVKVKTRSKLSKLSETVVEENEEQGSEPLCNTLKDVMFSNQDNIRNDILENNLNEYRKPKVHFFVYCPTCKALKSGKIRVRCNFCKSGAFTVHSDPQNWNDVLESKQITGLCENSPEFCADILNNREPTFAEFYFKCSEHTSLGEKDGAVPLYLIRPNLREIPCLACTDIRDPVFVFPCAEGHVTCLDCFRQYCSTKLMERQFWQHPEYGYTLACPAGCPDSFLKEVHHFRLLSETQYAQYQRFGTEEFVLRSGGVLCPQPGCGMGIIPDSYCTKITCINGCGYVFCRHCLQGYHIGECQNSDNEDSTNPESCSYNVDPEKAAEARWDEASKRAIKVLTKPCPKCRTPTERDGGCMHMICTRAGCEYHWCWVCQTQWTRECMGSHWFG
ncbi:E3 ubiquitin-protein ligase parkin isoform X2 [Anoplophora glabripennis]|nr:E3 ubiquitin-protein ligase parkin isoform X2 [Anoplophora glabripennis]